MTGGNTNHYTTADLRNQSPSIFSNLMSNQLSVKARAKHKNTKEKKGRKQHEDFPEHLGNILERETKSQATMGYARDGRTSGKPAFRKFRGKAGPENRAKVENVI